MDYNGDNVDNVENEEISQDQANEHNEKISSLVKHRRKKNEIEKDYICGDPNCARRYGTNAALYTHIKNKHQGVAPTGTIKPSSSLKKGVTISQDDQQTAHDQNEVQPKLIPKINGISKEEEEKTQIFDIITNPSFTIFSYELGRLGQIDGDNLIVRESVEDYYQIKEEQIVEFFTEILQKIQMSFTDDQTVNINTQFSKQALQFLVHTSPFWKKNSIKDVYLFLIFSYVFEGCYFEKFLEEIQNQNNKYPIFLRLIDHQKKSVIQEVYSTVWKVLTIVQ